MYSAVPGLPPWQARGNHTNLNDRSAYISVPARHSFAPTSSLSPPPTYTPTPLASHVSAPQSAISASTTSPSAPPALSARKKVVWSPAVREYVQRSFALENYLDGISKEDIEVRLKKVITDATTSGNLDLVNWAELPLPQQMIKEERRLSVVVPPLVPTLWPPPPVPQPTPREALNQQPEHPRKRKSSDLADELVITTAIPPWRNKKSNSAFEDRVTFAASSEKRQKINHQGNNTSKSHANLENRKKRFEDARSGSYSPQNGNTSHGASPPAADAGPVVGRLQKLEKNYFRLTSAPNPEDVRPIEVLRQTLELLKQKWKSESSYTYICDQFKSLRQDLTVQHIKNDFTVSVYEIHARIALEKGDLGEYNQCQTQLRALYKQNLGGHPVEFKAYRILYFIHTCNRTDMNDVLSDLTPADKLEPAIKHALDVRSALALGNYHKFFQLYLSVPKMGAYLMDMFIARERLGALASICKSYKPDVKIRFITEELGFESDQDAAQFILNYGAEGLLEEREGVVRLLTGKANSLFEIAKGTAFRSVDIKGQI